MSQHFTIHALIGCPFTLRVVMTAQCLNLNIKVKWIQEKWQLKTNEYLALNNEGTSGLLETAHGNITDSAAAMKYFARLDTKQNLYGRTNFERAQVDMLIDEVRNACMPILRNRGMEKAQQSGVQKDLTDAYNKAPMTFKGLEDRLGKGTYLLGEHMTIADITCVSIMWFNRGCTLPASVMKRLPNLQRLFNHITSQSWWTRVFGKSFPINKSLNVPSANDVTAFNNDPANDPVNIARAKQGLPIASTTKAPEATKAEEPKPLTGKAAVQAKLAEQKAKKDAKPAKAPVIAKSSVVFDVKGYELDQDYEKIAQRIRAEVNMDGLVWMDVQKILPIAFGMKKLQMTMLIEDEKVQTDDVFELIEAWEDEVQSVDIFAFSKA